jgi:hypothetical protein
VSYLAMAVQMPHLALIETKRPQYVKSSTTVNLMNLHKQSYSLK